jgi:hypothetical protein
MVEVFKANKLKLSDYDVMLTLGTGEFYIFMSFREFREGAFGQG